MKGKFFIFAALALMVFGAYTLNSARAQRPEEAQVINQRLAIQDIDPRLVDVEKACTADEVTIKKDGAAGSGNADNCENAKKKCRASLARSIASIANDECKLYSKVSDEREMCKAHRGNFNPTENIKYTPANCTQLVDATWSVECKNNVSDVKYTCN